MKILLIANYPPDRQESMLRFAHMLESGLRARGFEVQVARPDVVVGGLVDGRSALRKWLGYVDKLLLFPRRLRNRTAWADVVHICDHSNAIYSTVVSGRPVLVTCHDMLAVRSAVGELGENATGWTGRLYQRMIRYGLHKSPTVVCVSEATRKDLARLVNSSSQSLEVVHNGLNYPYSPMDKSDAMSQLKALGIEEGSQYLLHVGGNHWYKNRMGVLRIFRELIRLQDMQDIQLVLAGEPGTAEMNSYITVNGLDARVTVLTGVDNEQLRALYSSARGLLFPSLYEGFGWPIIEAQACGCPVFTTNRPPMTEVGGSSAIYIDPQNYPDAAGRIATALLLGEGGGQAALDNAARFGAGAMVDGYISIYRRIADKS